MDVLMPLEQTFIQCILKGRFCTSCMVLSLRSPQSSRMQNHKKILQNAENSQLFLFILLSSCSRQSQTSFLIINPPSPLTNFPTPQSQCWDFCTLLDGSIFGEVKVGDGDRTDEKPTWEKINSFLVFGTQSLSGVTRRVTVELSIMPAPACIHPTLAVPILCAGLGGRHQGQFTAPVFLGHTAIMK